ALATNASVVFDAVQPLSDVVAMTWSIAAIYFAMKSAKNTRWAALAGFAFAVSAWVRPTNALLGPAILAALFFPVEDRRPRLSNLPRTGGGACPPRGRILACVITTAIFVAPLLAWNASLYGGPLRNGYGSLSDMLATEFFATHAPHYLKWTAALLSPFALLGA